MSIHATSLLDMAGLVRTHVLAPVGVVLAALTSVHVLRTKRDPGAALAWIGLAWLTPIIGGGLYVSFGINRVRRRAQRLVQRRTGGRRRNRAPARDWSGHLAPLERAGSRITGRPMLRGNRFDLLENGDQAYPAMIAAIDAAEHTVALLSYILIDDRAGRPVIEALGRAHARGVAVRVLIDGIGSGWFWSGARHALRRRGVPVAQFLHSFWPWRMPFLNLRTHKKILLVDGAIGFTGGMNISAANLLADRPRHPVRDLHFRVTGPAVGQLAEAFARDWAFTTGEELDPAVWARRDDARGDGDDEQAPRRKDDTTQRGGEADARVATSGPDSDIEKIEFLVLQAISCARERIAVLTPYFLPEERIMTALGLAAQRGVAVDIVVPARSNQRLVDWATAANVGPLLADGARIWRNPPPFEHSKLMVVDGLWSLIGSANWDMRSFRLNFELTVEVYDEALARKLEAVVTSRRGEPLTRAVLDARPAWSKLWHATVRLMLPYL